MALEPFDTLVKGVQGQAARYLRGEVDNCRGAAECRGARGSLRRLGLGALTFGPQRRDRPGYVSVRVYPSRYDDMTGCVHHAPRILSDFTRLSDGDDPLSSHGDVQLCNPVRSYDATTSYDQIKHGVPPRERRCANSTPVALACSPLSTGVAKNATGHSTLPAPPALLRPQPNDMLATGRGVAQFG